ncbi:MAG: aminotransferase class V-fold PLP-dependent enzyme [Gemmatimonadetes bacterium]|nr:aminotransferase class V-fold PLP-dependent enzyme [Gemmatimonadota bacterium]
MAESFADLRAREYARLDERGHVYLDYTGSGLYARSQVERLTALLHDEVFGNPHSLSPTSETSTQQVTETRRRVLRFFGADPAEYAVIFTSNATTAAKLVGEAYPFGPGGALVLTADNHNSVNGIGEYARAHGARTVYLPLDQEQRASALPQLLPQAAAGAASLFAYPAQSNFTGVKHPLEWVALGHERGYDVLLDAAAYVPTNPLDLAALEPDFVIVSFYKMFGYPTGVGALIARHGALQRLQRPWFAGGTVRFASAQNQLHLLKDNAEAWEDGTPNFLAIAAVPFGLDLLEGVGMARVRDHVRELTDALLQQLAALRHDNGAPMVRIYGPGTTAMRGGTVSFNLLDPEGSLIDSDTVQEAAAGADISLRSGCFCNPGAAEYAFHYPAAASRHCLEGIAPEDFSLQRFSDCMGGVPVGALRASLGPPTNAADIERLGLLLAGFRNRRAAGGGGSDGCERTRRTP